MRKFVIAVLALLVPFTMYAAGCRQDSKHAAFPKGPEVKSLARAGSFESDRPTIPYIPPAIDPEVMSAPEQPALARVQAVMDREAQLTGSYASAPGLFVLPQNDVYAMAAPAPQPMPQMHAYATAPVQQPQRVLSFGQPYEPLPEPVSLMNGAPAPVQPRSEFWSKPVMSVQPIPAMPAPGTDSMLPPATLQPIPGIVDPYAPPAAAPDHGSDKLLLPESIPGVFLGATDAREPVAWFERPANWDKAAGESTPPPLSSWAPASPGRSERAAVQREVAAAPAQTAREPLSFDASAPADIRKALEPLPNLVPLSERSAAASAMVPSPSLFNDSAMPNLAESLIRDSAQPKPAEVMGQSDPAKPAIAARDMYRMDFWEDKPGKAPQLDHIEFKAPPSIMDYAPKTQAPAEPAKQPEEAAPQKIQLKPLAPMRLKSLDAIDSETAPPPLRF